MGKKKTQHKILTASEDKLERSFFALDEFKETKANGSSDVFTFSGYGAVYNNVDWGDDVMEPGCFDDSLRVLTPQLLWMHIDTEPVGIFSQISSDTYGLRVNCEMPKDDTFVLGRVFPQIRIGSVRGLSIGYVVEKYFIDNEDRRHIVQCRLLEISLVGQPKNSAATITEFKKLAGKQATKEEENNNDSNRSDEAKKFDALNVKLSAQMAETKSIMSDILRDARTLELLME